MVLMATAGVGASASGSGSSGKVLFRKWVGERYVPSVLCIGTDKVEESCCFNGLSLTELLMPFGVLQSVSVPIRTVNKSYSLSDFRFRFIQHSECQPVSPTLGDAFQLEKASQQEATIDLTQSGVPRRRDSLSTTSYSNLSCFTHYRRAMLDTIKHQPTHMLDHPVAILFFASTRDEPSPIEWLNNLQQKQNLPTPFQTGQYNPEISRFYVLVNDRSLDSEHPVDVQQQYITMCNNFPADRCYLIQINSLDKSKPNRTQPDIWSHLFSPRFFPEQEPKVVQAMIQKRTDPRMKQIVLGEMLSPDDLKGLQSFVQGLAFDGILRDTERRMLALNQEVTAARKGLRNAFKLMWRRPNSSTKAKTTSTGIHSSVSSSSSSADGSAGTGTGSSMSYREGDSGSGEIIYKYDMIETQIRILADLAFMVQDYEMALGLYRLARDDYASEKALLYKASTLEMMALCQFMTEGNKKQILEYMNKAIIECYTPLLAQSNETANAMNTSVRNIVRLSTNGTLLFTDLLRCSYVASSDSGNFIRKASEFYLRASFNENKLSAGMLLEQAGICLLMYGLRHKPEYSPLAFSLNNGTIPLNVSLESRMARKYAFHMVMAASLFKQSGLMKHAIRCLQAVKPYYDQLSWKHINTHIGFMLGALNRSLYQQKTEIAGDSDDNEAKNKLENTIYLWGGVLESGNQPHYKQATLLKDFQKDLSLYNSRFVNESGSLSKPKIWSFNLPKILDEKVMVQPQQNASLLPFIVDEVCDEDRKFDWTSIEAMCETHVKSGTFNTIPLTRRQRILLEENPKPTTCFVNEPLLIDVPFSNPLQHELLITNIKIEANLLQEQIGGSENTEFTNQFEQDEVEVVLKPLEERRIRLKITPKAAGQIQVYGISFNLFGLATVLHEFRVQGKLLNSTKEQRMTGMRAKDIRFCLVCKPQSSWLGAEIRINDLEMNVDKDTPEQALLSTGQIVSAELDLINNGLETCTGPIFACVNIPAMYISEKTNEEIIEESDMKPLLPLDEDGLIYKLPIETMEPGAPITFPLQLRLPENFDVRTSPSKLRLVLSYDHSSNKRRYLRYVLPFKATTGVKINANCVPRVDIAGEYLLSVAVANNLLKQKKLNISCLECVSKEWRIESIDDLNPKSSKSFHAASLRPREVTNIVCRLVSNAINVKKGEVTVSKLYNENTPINANATSRINWEIDVGKHFLRLENATLTLRQRKKEKMEYLKRRQELEAQGKLPVSIQQIRRAKENEQENLTNDVGINKNQNKGEPFATSDAAMLWGNRSRAEMHLSVYWKASDSDEGDNSNDLVCRGQSCHLNVPVYPSCPVIALVDTPSDEVTHDFDAESICMIPINVILCSTSTQVIPECIIQVIGNSDKNESSSNAQVGYFWCGTTCRSVKDLKPNAQVRVSMSIAVIEAGTFSLENIQVLIKFEEGDTTPLGSQTTIQMEHRKMITVLHASGKDKSHSGQSAKQGEAGNLSKMVDACVKEEIEEQSEGDNPELAALVIKASDISACNNQITNVEEGDYTADIHKGILNDQVKTIGSSEGKRRNQMTQKDSDDDLLLSDSEDNGAVQSEDVDENFLLELEKELS